MYEAVELAQSCLGVSLVEVRDNREQSRMMKDLAGDSRGPRGRTTATRASDI
jgi:hypothetical protein